MPLPVDLSDVERPLAYRTFGLGCVGQVGIFGPHAGTGSPAVAAWWLTIAFVADGEKDAAAAPATTRERAKIRTASFMISYPLKDFVVDRVSKLESPRIVTQKL